MPSLLETARGMEDIKTFFELIEKVELGTVLDGFGQFTIFAPGEAAFAAAPKDILNEFLKMFFNTKVLVTHHIVPGGFSHNDLLPKDKENLMSVGNTALRVTDTYGTARIAGANLLTRDVKADNGYIHIIDRVLLPNEHLIDDLKGQY